jgi:hypothetical protein
MTVHIGDLSQDTGVIDMTFTYFGETIRVHPHASDLEFTEFLDSASKIAVADVNRIDEVKAVQALMDFMKGQIHPDDWDLFWKTAKANDQTTIKVMAVSKSIVEAVSGFPTQQQPASSGGPANAAGKFRDTSHGRVERKARRKEQRRKDKAARLAARPRVTVVPALEDISEPRAQDTVSPMAQRALSLLPGRLDLQAVVYRVDRERDALAREAASA